MTDAATPSLSARFEAAPSFAGLVASEGWAEVARAEGAGRWAMPICTWFAPGGLDARDERGSDHHTLAFLLSGPGIEGRRGRRFSALRSERREFFSVQPPGVATHYWTRHPTRFLHLYFNDQFLRGLAVELFGSAADQVGLLPEDTIFAADRDLRSMTDAYMVAAFAGEGRPSALEMDSRANLIGLSLLRRHSVLAPRTEVRPMALAPLRLARVKDYVEANLADDLSLGQIAEAAELSPFHFARAFKRETGMPPHRYLMERRVERARELLAGTGLGLAEIALACGFAGQSHFTTAFKRHTGVAPGAWRVAVRH